MDSLYLFLSKDPQGNLKIYCNRIFTKKKQHFYFILIIFFVIFESHHLMSFQTKNQKTEHIKHGMCFYTFYFSQIQSYCNNLHQQV